MKANRLSGLLLYLILIATAFRLSARAADLRKIDPDTAREAEDFILNGGPLGVVDDSWTDTPLPNGKELITGGEFTTKLNPTLFNTRLKFPGLIAAPSGFQTGGPTETCYVFSRAQLFDPITGKRTETGSMNIVRYGHIATLLHNGKVLVAGGENLDADGRVKSPFQC